MNRDVSREERRISPSESSQRDSISNNTENQERSDSHTSGNLHATEEESFSTSSKSILSPTRPGSNEQKTEDPRSQSITYSDHDQQSDHRDPHDGGDPASFKLQQAIRDIFPAYSDGNVWPSSDFSRRNPSAAQPSASLIGVSDSSNVSWSRWMQTHADQLQSLQNAHASRPGNSSLLTGGNMTSQAAGATERKDPNASDPNSRTANVNIATVNNNASINTNNRNQFETPSYQTVQSPPVESTAANLQGGASSASLPHPSMTRDMPMSSFRVLTDTVSVFMDNHSLSGAASDINSADRLSTASAKLREGFFPRSKTEPPVNDRLQPQPQIGTVGAQLRLSSDSAVAMDGHWTQNAEWLARLRGNQPDVSMSSMNPPFGGHSYLNPITFRTSSSNTFERLYTDVLPQLQSSPYQLSWTHSNIVPSGSGLMNQPSVPRIDLTTQLGMTHRTSAALSGYEKFIDNQGTIWPSSPAPRVPNNPNTGVSDAAAAAFAPRFLSSFPQLHQNTFSTLQMPMSYPPPSVPWIPQLPNLSRPQMQGPLAGDMTAQDTRNTLASVVDALTQLHNSFSPTKSIPSSRETPSVRTEGSGDLSSLRNTFESLSAPKPSSPSNASNDNSSDQLMSPIEQVAPHSRYRKLLKEQYEELQALCCADKSSVPRIKILEHAAKKLKTMQREIEKLEGAIGARAKLLHNRSAGMWFNQTALKTEVIHREWFQQSAVPCFILSSQLQFIDANGAFSILIGCEVPDLRHKNLIDVVATQERERTKRRLMSMVRSHESLSDGIRFKLICSGTVREHLYAVWCSFVVNEALSRRADPSVSNGSLYVYGVG